MARSSRLRIPVPTDARSNMASNQSKPTRLCAVFIVLALMAPTALFSQQAPQGPPVPQQGPQQPDPGADPHAAEELAAQRQALGFLGYLDDGRFADSYAYTGMVIRKQLD